MKEPHKRTKEKRRGPKRPRFMRVKYDGRGMLLSGALLLLALSGYELYVRLDDFSRMVDGVRYLSAVKNESFVENLLITLEAPGMVSLRNILIFLSACVILSLVCLLCSNRPRAGVPVMLLDAAVFLSGLLLKGVAVFTFAGLLQWVKLFPLLLILIGAAVNLIEGKLAGRYAEERRTAAKEEEKTAPCDTERSAG